MTYVSLVYLGLGFHALFSFSYGSLELPKHNIEGISMKDMGASRLHHLGRWRTISFSIGVVCSGAVLSEKLHLTVDVLEIPKFCFQMSILISMKEAPWEMLWNGWHVFLFMFHSQRSNQWKCKKEFHSWCLKIVCSLPHMAHQIW